MREGLFSAEDLVVKARWVQGSGDWDVGGDCMVALELAGVGICVDVKLLKLVANR